MDTHMPANRERGTRAHTHSRIQRCFVNVLRAYPCLICLLPCCLVPSLAARLLPSRSSDDVVAVAKLCQALGVPHIVNNAYGVQAAALTAAVTSACRKGRVDAIVQSTDKNFMVRGAVQFTMDVQGQPADFL